MGLRLGTSPTSVDGTSAILVEGAVEHQSRTMAGVALLSDCYSGLVPHTPETVPVYGLSVIDVSERLGEGLAV